MDGQTKELHKQFGKVLRELRNRTGLSQEQLGLECNLDRTFISLLERGLRQPTLTTLFVLAHKLNVSPVEIVQKIEDEFLKQTESK
ncbi:helix-turn-helix domain-containing protein [Nitrosomonas sp.]|uniref:helix-turn-helix domain-containing protein n=1 Tax=Nitrosomonas sp. TaxID=42353 RepID=UPI001D9A2C5A|nr:helix-turn-helix transcriptional regulator [Nitrosomonas sp.]MBX3618098.1 helix-turn-helix transcriptional regulator [Nitrosomonas sp.]